MVLKAVEILRRPKEEVLYVGDMTIDIETCRRAGIDVAVVPGGSDTREKLLAGGPDHLLGSFDAIAALFAGQA